VSSHEQSNRPESATLIARFSFSLVALASHVSQSLSLFGKMPRTGDPSLVDVISAVRRVARLAHPEGERMRSRKGG